MPDRTATVKGTAWDQALMLPTLQSYIFRELGKTFVLTAIGLTGILSTCGGVYALAPLEQITPAQTVWLLVLVVPMCGAFTLPFAALFSATVTYGRMAADNEFTACRSSGVSTFALFLPCIAISVVSGLLTFVLFNFVIPGFMGQVHGRLRVSIPQLITKTLHDGRSVNLQGNHIHAGAVESVGLGGGEDRVEAILLTDVAFAEYEDNELVRYGRGESAMVKFDFEGESPTIMADLHSIQVYDLAERTLKWEHETLGPYSFDQSVRLRPKHMSLIRLLDSLTRPEEVFPKLRSQLQKTRELVLAKLCFEHLARQISEHGGTFLLSTSDRSVTVQAASAQIERNLKKGAFWLSLSDVRLEETSPIGRASYQAGAARIELELREDREPAILLELLDKVTVRDSRDPDHPRIVDSRTIDALNLPEPVRVAFNKAKYADRALCDETVRLDLGSEIEHQRGLLHGKRRELLNDINSELSVRTVYSLSVIVLAVLGAALGVIFRGGQLLVAFGISFLPTVFVIALAILGRQLAKGDDSLVIGLCVMWGGLIATAGLDLVVFKKFLPR